MRAPVAREARNPSRAIRQQRSSHLGTLARLAEHGLLRHVEALSTVSGGSIVGALYYLHLKNLHEAKRADEIADDDYLAVVADMAKGLEAAVRRNLRVNAFLAHPWRNFGLARRGYSRTHLIGQLYEEWLYRRVWEGEGPFVDFRSRWPERPERIEMRALLIHPAGEAGDFDIDTFNERSPAKIPVLLLNAANLASGHGWRFEAEYMGEHDVDRPRAAAQLGEGSASKPKEIVVEDPARAELDKNTIFARSKWSEVPGDTEKLTLGAAVAASSAFPVLFRPYEIRGVFWRGGHRRVEAKLMDGGAFGEVESRSLALDAYLMTGRELEDQSVAAAEEASRLAENDEPVPDKLAIADFATGARAEKAWPFRTPTIEWHLSRPPLRAYELQLTASASLLLKPLAILGGYGAVLRGALIAAALGGLCVGIWQLWAANVDVNLAVTAIALVRVAFLVGLYAAPRAPLLSQLGAALYDVLFPLLFAFAAVVLWLPAKLWNAYWTRVYLDLSGEEWLEREAADELDAKRRAGLGRASE